MLNQHHHIYIVNHEQSGERLDVVVVDAFGISRSQAQKAIKQGNIQVNNTMKDKASFVVSAGDHITRQEVQPVFEDQKNSKKINMDIPIVAETNDYLVINKPCGVLVHPTQAGERGTLVEWLVHTYPSIASVGDSPERPGIVHRLDKEASGLLVIAKTPEMFHHLKEQFQNRTVEKEYTVLVHGNIPLEHGMIDFDIDRGRDGVMVSRPHVDVLSLKSVAKKQPGKEALTEFWVEKQYARFALLKVKIYTGRTHQIRVHFFAYNHPVVGDDLYVNKKLNRKRDQTLGRLFLHATRLSFVDLAGKTGEYTVVLPEKLSEFLASLH